MAELTGMATRKPDCSVWISPILGRLRQSWPPQADTDVPVYEDIPEADAQGAETTPEPATEPDVAEPVVVKPQGPFERVRLRRDGARPLVFDGALLFDIEVARERPATEAADGKDKSEKTGPEVRFRAFVLPSGEIAAAASIECDRTPSSMPRYAATMVSDQRNLEQELHQLLGSEGDYGKVGREILHTKDACTLKNLHLGLLRRAGLRHEPSPEEEPS